MPYSRPPYSQLQSDAASDIAGALPGADPLLRFANLTIIGKILARMANLHYGFLDWISRMAVPFTAQDEYLLGWAALKGVTLKQATFAGSSGGAVLYTGSTGVSYTIPAGTILARGDGAQFKTQADMTGVSTVNVTGALALVAGAAGNTDAGSVLTLGISISGLNSNGAVTTAFTGGADVETMDQLRSRMLQVYQNPPMGGAVADYIKWALEVPGVTRAWVKALGMGAGTVVVYFMEDVSQAIHGGFPQGSNGVATAETRAVAATGDQLAVANYIYGDVNTARQPVGALVYCVAPIADAIAFTIKNIAGVSAGIKTQINAAIDGVFLEFGAPGGVIDLSDIESAIAAIPGTEGFVITVPSDNITLPAGNLPTRGAVTYI